MAIEWHAIARNRGYGTPGEMLTYLYHDRRMSLNEIAQLFRVSSAAIWQAMIKFDVKRRKHGGARFKRREGVGVGKPDGRTDG